ncbi:MAG: hypothetical protein K1X92_10575 [Bacteroidia bacterium]|nr:hypothetical protein [Bacteroidia bacterium]
MIKQTELILQSAAKQLVSATNNLQKVMAELVKNVEAVDAQNQVITENEAKIEELTTKYTEKSREAEVNFSLSLKENQKSTVEKILGEQGFTAIKNEELTELKQELEKIKTNFNEEVKKAETQVKTELTAKMEAQRITMNLEKKAEMAELNGKLSSSLDKITILEVQLKTAREEIIAMRNAETERVKAFSSRDVVINNSNPQR